MKPRSTREGREERHLSFDVSDLEEIHDLTRRTQIPVAAELSRPLRPIRFRGVHRSLSPIELTEAELHYDHGYSVKAAPMASAYHLQIPLDGRSRVRHGRRSVDVFPNGSGVLLSPTQATSWRSEGSFREVTVNVDRRALEERWRTLTGSDVEGDLTFRPALPLDRAPVRALAHLVQRLLEVPGAAEGRHLRLVDALLDTLLLRLPHDHAHHLREDPKDADERLVSRAAEWIEAHASGTIRVSHVADAMGVSMRTLQRAFRRRRDLSPGSFLKGLRLEKARELLRSGMGRLSVTEAALRCGFVHLGQFSVDYRRRFGESPSSTLRRARAS